MYEKKKHSKTELLNKSINKGKKSIMEFIKGIHDSLINYHDHKEKSAWIGAVFFSVAAIGFIPVINDLISEMCLYVQIIISIVTAGLIFWFKSYVKKYVKGQLKLRSMAAYIQLVCLKILGELEVGEIKLNPNDLKPIEDNKTYVENVLFLYLPSIITKRYNEEQENKKKKKKDWEDKKKTLKEEKKWKEEKKKWKEEIPVLQILEQLPRKIIDVAAVLSIIGILIGPAYALISKVFCF